MPTGFGFAAKMSRYLTHIKRLADPAEPVARFLARASTLSDQELQHLMARVTGNYKRGNERAAPRHPRNR